MTLGTCPECQQPLSDKALACPHCGAPGRAVPPGWPKLMVAGLMGWEWRSETTLWGLPLVHVATGVDLQTGRKRVAKGIIAIGDIAIGCMAMGGLALGGVTLGGLSIGVAALGGAALGAGLAVGGVAVGGVALGGAAVGYYAFGGAAFGVHPCGADACDPAAMDFLKQRLGAGADALLQKHR